MHFLNIYLSSYLTEYHKMYEFVTKDTHTHTSAPFRRGNLALKGGLTRKLDHDVITRCVESGAHIISILPFSYRRKTSNNNYTRKNKLH